MSESFGEPVSAPLRASCAERAARVRFRRALALLTMTLFVPGSAQLVAGNRQVGRIALRIWVGLILLVVGSFGIAAIDHGYAIWAASSPSVLQVLRIGLIVLAIAWAWLFFDAWRIGQPPSLLLAHRRTTLGINAALCLAVAGGLLMGSHVVGVQRGLMVSMFSGTDVVGAHAGRYNLLLLGGDAGVGRTGLRPDSITVASIDARTGKAVLIGLPRNMSNFKFAEGSVMAEQFPRGWGGDGRYLNGLSTWAMDHKALFRGTPNGRRPGVEATIEGVEGITGLKINYWAMVNLHGFHQLVDAVGGVKLTVRQAVPIGKTGEIIGWIKPGTRTLSGEQVLWYTRSRATSDDYSRMARQKCVMGAMLSQLSPQTVLTHFTKIASASSSMVSTSIPASEVGRFASLALKAKSQKIATVSLVPPAIVTSRPDLAKVRAMITGAINRSEHPKKAKAKAKPASSGTPTTGTPTKPAAQPTSEKTITGGSYGSLKSGYEANQSDNLAASC